MRLKAPEGLHGATHNGVAFVALKSGLLSTDGKAPADVGPVAAAALAEHGCTIVAEPGEPVPPDVQAVADAFAASATANAAETARGRAAFLAANPHLAG